MGTKLIGLLSLLLVLTLTPCYAQFGGLSKWFNKEVVPTIKGDRPLKIDPKRVRISQNGKDILRVSAEGNGSVYVDLGVAKIQTNDLRKEIARTAAVFSGNTAVMTQVAFEQFQQLNSKQLKEAQEANLVKISKTPPPNPTTIQQTSTPSKQVIIYNHTSAPLNYALNGNFFKLEPDEGYKHTSSSGNFFLQFDSNASDSVNIARYYLTGTEYSLYLYEGMKNIGIYRY